MRSCVWSIYSLFASFFVCFLSYFKKYWIFLFKISTSYIWTYLQLIENLRKMRKTILVKVITIWKFLSHKKPYKMFCIFSIFPNYEFFKRSILCGHFDTRIVDFKLFWKNNCLFLTKIQFEKGCVIMNREGVKKSFFQIR